MYDADRITELLRRGVAAAKAGRREEARQILLHVVELDERNEQAWLWLSGVVDACEDRRVCLENVLTINPENSHARQGLHRLDRQVAAISTAEERCPRCHVPVPPSGRTCPNCGQLLVVACPRCGAYVEVEHVVCIDCGHFLGDFRDGAGYYISLARGYLEQQRFALVQEATVRAEAESPDDPQVLQEVAALHEEMGHTDLAVAVYRRAIERYPDNPVYYARLGGIYRRRAMPDDAREMYERAVKLDSGDPAALFALAELYVEDGLLDSARKLLEHAIKSDPGHTQAHLLLSDVYHRLGRGKLAVQHYRQAAASSAPGSATGQRAQRELVRLAPSLPERRAQGWGETSRRTFGLMLPLVLAAWVNAGLVPWRISPTTWVALGGAAVGAYMWTCAADVPRNEVMLAVFGREGVKGFWRQALVGAPGVVLWAVAFGLILGRV
jgi:tetratricopeptide (TPR) repeat protein